MSDNTHCNFRREKCSQERSQNFYNIKKDLTTETRRTLNVIKMIPVEMGQHETYQNNSENI
jgi:hypothetical protein